MGCRLWGHTESDTTEATQQQQQQQQQREWTGLRLLDLANKSTDCAVTFKLQISNESAIWDTFMLKKKKRKKKDLLFI